jgi:hypothetical protein
MKRLGFTVPLAALVVAACAPVQRIGSPVPEPGDRIRYSLAIDSGRLYTGRAVRLDGDTIVVDRLVSSMIGGAAEWDSAAFATSSLARLEMRVGRRGNAGRGALIGGGVGLLLGVFCAIDTEEGWLEPSPAECVSISTLGGAMTGGLIGMLIRSDVWEPVVLPLRPPTVPGDPAITASSFGIGIRIRTPSPR